MNLKHMFLGFWVCVFPLAVQAQLILPPEPTINASGYVLMDAETRDVLLSTNSHERLPPASLTKIMTSYLAAAEIDAGRIALEDEVPVSTNAWKTEGSRMFIDPNTTVPLIDLLRGIVVQSGNDASVAVAEYIAGSEDQFAEMMNAVAEVLGLENTHFTNSTGLPNDYHYMTAHDVALLSEALIRQYPDHYQLYAERDFEYNGIKQPNRNRLLALDSSVDGIKTGYTEAAGYCLAVSAERDGLRLISVVMGTASTSARVTETRKLLSYGFRNYETKVIYEELQPVADVRVWYGTQDQLSVGVGETLKKTMIRSLFDEVNHQLNLPATIEAPIERGQQVGEMIVLAEDEELAVLPLIALIDIEEKGLFGRLWDSVQLMLEPSETTVEQDVAE